MPIRLEAYTFEGILTGLLDAAGHARDVLETSTDVALERASVAALDGSRADQPSVRVAVDDLVLVVPDEELTRPVHATWHAVRVEAGPWLVEGELPTMPGFDPGRALTRPTGTFVLLRDVRVALLGFPDAGVNAYPQALVNRYAVDAVDADLMLGFFFPGARVDLTPPPPVPEAAPQPAAPPSNAAEPAAPGSDPTLASAPPPTPAA